MPTTSMIGVFELAVALEPRRDRSFVLLEHVLGIENEALRVDEPFDVQLRLQGS